MSAIFARAAARNFTAAAGHRQFSVMRAVRSYARSFEGHTFQRLPASSGVAKPDYGRLMKRVASSFAINTPVALVVLGWPLGVKYVAQQRT